MSDYTIAATEATKEHKSRGTKTNYKQQTTKQAAAKRNNNNNIDHRWNLVLIQLYF
jgi:hypothetical protein